MALSALLLACVAAATVGFARSQPAWRARRGGGRTAVGAVAAASAPGSASHVTPAGDVATLFQRRVAELEARLEAAPSDRSALLELARLLHDGHRVPDAISLYRKALDLDPSDAQVWYDLATAHGEIGAWDRAAEVLMDRLERAPADAVALYDLGAVRANQGRLEEARRHFEAAEGLATDGVLKARISSALARLKAL